MLARSGIDGSNGSDEKVTDTTTESGSENWYILQVEDATASSTTLNGEGIPCHDITKQFNNRQAICFPSSYVNSVLDNLNRQSSDYMLEPSNIANMHIMVITDGENEFVRPPQVDHFEAWSDLVPVIKAAHKVLGVRLILDNPHRSVKNPTPTTDENIVYVHFWSAPKDKGETKLKKVFGYSLSGGQMDAMKPSGIGTVLHDNDGVTFGECIDNNLYILFDLPHGGSDVTLVFANIMKKFFEFKERTVEELTEFWQAIIYGSSMDSSTAKDLFIKSCSKLYEKNLSKMEETLKEYDKRLDQHTQEVVKVTREREVLLMKYEPLKGSTEERKKWAGNEYDVLCASPHVKRVVVKGKTIQVFTDMISIQHHMLTYDIGEFRIDINTDGDASGVKAFNLTRNIEGILAHPHVKANGYCCLGNISEGVIKLLAEYQYVILAQLMITYLHSYNSDSAYGKIELWR
jgi:hypothetical protein